MILLASTTSFVTFLASAAFGFVFVVFGSILGDIFDRGDLGRESDGHGGGPSILSSRILSVFITALGSFGAIGVHFGYGVGASAAMGFGGGVLFAEVIYTFAGLLYGQRASSHVRMGDSVGNTAQVSVSIPQGGARCVARWATRLWKR